MSPIGQHVANMSSGKMSHDNTIEVMEEVSVTSESRSALSSMLACLEGDSFRLAACKHFGNIQTQTSRCEVSYEQIRAHVSVCRKHHDARVHDVYRVLQDKSAGGRVE